MRPRKERNCETVVGRGQSEIADTLEGSTSIPFWDMGGAVIPPPGTTETFLTAHLRHASKLRKQFAEEIENNVTNDNYDEDLVRAEDALYSVESDLMALLPTSAWASTSPPMSTPATTSPPPPPPPAAPVASPPAASVVPTRSDLRAPL